jgi:hypothetical protein
MLAALVVMLGQARSQVPSAGTPPRTSTLSAAQLDPLTASIALYPDRARHRAVRS